MKAAVLENPRQGRAAMSGRLTTRSPRPGEAVMKVRAGGINRIDLYMRDAAARASPMNCRSSSASMAPAKLSRRPRGLI